MTCIRTACEAWPAIELGAKRFAELVADKDVGDGGDVQHLSDLYVACAALEADERATAVLQRWVRAAANQSIAATRSSDYGVDELVQDLLVKLLVRDGERLPRLSQYTGRGPLRSWLRTCAINECLARRRKSNPQVPTADVAELAPASRDEPELELLKGSNLTAFNAALTEAFAGLQAEGRVLLRFYYVDHLQHWEIANLLGVHESTISRRLSRIRERIEQGVRSRLEGSHGGVWNLVQSRIDVSLRVLLQTRAPL